jgi:hypothetical protein
LGPRGRCDAGRSPGFGPINDCEVSHVCNSEFNSHHCRVAVVLETTDLQTFTFASGYSSQVMSVPVRFTTCNPTYDSEFDENYAGPGSVVQDPTRPAGNLIMIYEAERIIARAASGSSPSTPRWDLHDLRATTSRLPAAPASCTF